MSERKRGHLKLASSRPLLPDAIPPRAITPEAITPTETTLDVKVGSYKGATTFYLITPTAVDWVKTNVDRPSYNGNDATFHVFDGRMSNDIIGGMLREGFTVEFNGRAIELSDSDE